MMRDDFEARIKSRLAELAPEPGLDFGDRLATAVSVTPQGGRPYAMPGGLFGTRRVGLLIAAALLVGLLAGAIAVGSGVIKLPSVLPPPSPTVEASTEPAPSISIEPSPAQALGLVAYSVIQPIDPPPDGCGTSIFHPWCSAERIWIANSDGTDAHELLPDVPGNQHVVAWMPDGARLLYAEDRGLALTDVNGSGPEIITATQCPDGTVTNCPNLGGVLSPDGSRLAYTLLPGTQADSSVVAILDLTTREITVLQSTRTTGVNEGCVTAAGQGDNGTPLWSPDGTRLIVTRVNIGPLDERGNCRSIVYSVNADGTDYRVVVPSGTRQQPSSGGWSPDGSHLVLSSMDADPNGGSDATCDIAIVRPDGSDLRQLTSDGISCNPLWTRDGRILFAKWIDLEAGTFDLWIMDADGSNARRLPDTSLAGLTDIGCIACSNPQSVNWSDVLWQPSP